MEGDLDSASSQFERSLDILKELGDSNGVAISLTCLGSLSHTRGDYDSAREFLSRAIALNRKTGNRAAEANSLNNLGCAERESGNASAARRAFEQALRINRELGFAWEASLNLTNLGLSALDAGNLESARKRLAEALGLAREVGARRDIAGCLEAWARLEASCNQAARSACLFGAVSGQLYALGLPPSKELNSLREELRRVLGDRAFEDESAVGRAMTQDQAIEHALEEPPRSE